MLLASKYTAIKQLTYSYLKAALSIYACHPKTACILEKKIPLSKGRDKNNIFYITGIALQLSKYEKLPAMEVAEAITSHFSEESADVFSVQIVPPGWIYLELTHSVLAAWLQSLAAGGVGNWAWGKEQGARDKGQGKNQYFNTQYPMPNAPCSLSHSLFTVQYAHARCCSLLRMAERERFIISANAIPWLNNQQKLRLNHPVELSLVSELVQVVDEIGCSGSDGSVKWEKLALSLSQAFEEFWRSCRIWGEVKAISPELAQTRLGLVMATQSVLRFLLEEKLGIFAPLEL
ncbi:MAG: glutamate acetyltransferase [Fischerella sp.]|jgi:arginyl-tRNA synthetase|uniref:DALR anticodon-binding domain-containing protein n=1 Tax=Fischerella sp. TaxID=1191 RepID=UPI0017C1EFF0|nr:DALR anticodon-binding domain-containing protein [Fischerella sp.]NWF60553.1 glutamate acetyltransferase [Fischerella sp.]